MASSSVMSSFLGGGRLPDYWVCVIFWERNGGNILGILTKNCRNHQSSTAAGQNSWITKILLNETSFLKKWVFLTVALLSDVFTVKLRAPSGSSWHLRSRLMSLWQQFVAESCTCSSNPITLSCFFHEPGRSVPPGRVASHLRPSRWGPSARAVMSQPPAVSCSPPLFASDGHNSRLCLGEPHSFFSVRHKLPNFASDICTTVRHRFKEIRTPNWRCIASFAISPPNVLYHPPPYWLATSCIIHLSALSLQAAVMSAKLPPCAHTHTHTYTQTQQDRLSCGPVC